MTLRLFTVGIFLSISTAFTAVGQRLTSFDTVYMNDGRVFSGEITELILDSIVSIRTDKVFTYTVNFSDVERITKSIRKGRSKIERPPRPVTPKDTVKRVFTERPKGYFFQAQLSLEYKQAGLLIVNGYKFHRLAHIGFGTGFNLLFEPMLVIPVNLTDKRSSGTAVHIPFFLHIGGDIKPKQTTPYYALGLGYALIANPKVAGRNGRNAIYGSAGFGIRFNSNRRFHTSFGWYLNVKNHDLLYYERYLDSTGIWQKESKTANTTIFFLGVRVVMGM